MCTHYTLLRNARSKQRSVHVPKQRSVHVPKQRSAHVRNSEVRTYDLLRKSVLRSFRMRKARLVVSRNRAKQEQIKSASGALRGRSPRGRRLGKSTPATSPGVGSFLGVKAKPLRGRCASLDPHPLRQCPSSPCAGLLWRVFSEGRVKGLVRPAAP